MLALFKSIVFLRSEYRCQLWSPATVNQIRAMENIERKFTKHIDGLYSLSYKERLFGFHMYSLQRRRERYAAIYLWKMLEDIVPNLSPPVTGNHRKEEIEKMGRRKGHKIVVPKGKATLYLEENYALNFDDITQDTVFTKGNILYYLIDHTVLNVADKLVPLLTSDDKKTLYARIHKLKQKHQKKHSKDLKNEHSMKRFETFCLQSFMVNSHPAEVAQDPQLRNTDDCANKGYQRQQRGVGVKLCVDSTYRETHGVYTMTENCCLCGNVFGKKDAGSTLTEATKQDPKLLSTISSILDIDVCVNELRESLHCTECGKSLQKILTIRKFLQTQTNVKDEIEVKVEAVPRTEPLHATEEVRQESNCNSNTDQKSDRHSKFLALQKKLAESRTANKQANIDLTQEIKDQNADDNDLDGNKTAKKRKHSGGYSEEEKSNDWKELKHYVGNSEHLLQEDNVDIKADLECRIDAALRDGDTSTAEQLSDQLSQRTLAMNVVSAFNAKEFVEQRKLILDKKKEKKKQKAAWGFVQKERWETKGNM